VNPPLPPYSLVPHRFPLRALATRAAGAPLGSAREVTLACLMAANLAAHQSLAALGDCRSNRTSKRKPLNLRP